MPQNVPGDTNLPNQHQRPDLVSFLREQRALQQQAERDALAEARQAQIMRAEWPPQPLVPFGGNFVYSTSTDEVSDEMLTVPVATPNPLPTTITKERERQLKRAVIEYFRNLEALPQPGPEERRESEYFSLMSNDSAPSSKDRLNGELPVSLDSVDHDQLKLMTFGTGIVPGPNGLSFVCAHCNDTIPRQYAFWNLGKVYCVDHLPKTAECASCHHIVTSFVIAAHEGESFAVCGRCSSRLRCKNCNVRLLISNTKTKQCDSCYARAPQNDFPRQYSKNRDWMSDERGKLIVSNRIFSCEIETLVPQTPNMVNELFTHIPRQIGISGDNSIRAHGMTMGIELQTPRLQGARGEELIARTTAGLKSLGATINDSCGLHIHLDAAGLFPASRADNPIALLQLWKAHLVFEDAVLSFLPYKRRMNRYCRPMRDYFKLSELDMLYSLYEVERMWYKQRHYANIAEEKGHHYHPSRYFGVNFHSLLAEKNLEIRYHSGTLNGKKIIHWVNLHSLIMDAAVKGSFTREVLTAAQATTDITEKAQILFSLIGLPSKSAQYFLDRQRKFTSKEQGEDESLSNITTS